MSLSPSIYPSVIPYTYRANAPADTSANEDNLTKEAECTLGLVPHQVSINVYIVLPEGILTLFNFEQWMTISLVVEYVKAMH